MRLLALAEIAGDEFERVFLVREELPVTTRTEVQATADNVVCLPAHDSITAEAAWLVTHILRSTDVLILDGYDFGFEYQATVRAAAGGLLYLDDLCAFPQAADVILNPAGGVTEALYDLRRVGARVFTGPMWAPLRAPFRAAALAPPAAAPPSQVLLCLGGADPDDHTYRLAADLVGLPYLDHLHVAVGIAYAHWDTLTHWAASQPATRLTLHRALPASDFCTLFQVCGAALLSSSTVSYEYASAGGGLLTVLPTAGNQRSIYDFLLREGLARPAAALPNMLSSPDRSHTQAVLRGAQRRYFDGSAPARLRTVLRGLTAQAALRLRQVTTADSELLLRWANDTLTRQNSYHSEPISRADHEHWLESKLAAPSTDLLLLAEVAGTPAGTIRFQLNPASGAATLGFSLAPDFRGIGLAPAVLRAGAVVAADHWGVAVQRVVGHVISNNTASQAAFRRAGFQEEKDTTTPPDSVSFHYQLT